MKTRKGVRAMVCRNCGRSDDVVVNDEAPTLLRCQDCGYGVLICNDVASMEDDEHTGGIILENVPIEYR